MCARACAYGRDEIVAGVATVMYMYMLVVVVVVVVVCFILLGLSQQAWPSYREPLCWTAFRLDSYSRNISARGEATTGTSKYGNFPRSSNVIHPRTCSWLRLGFSYDRAIDFSVRVYGQNLYVLRGKEVGIGVELKRERMSVCSTV